MSISSLSSSDPYATLISQMIQLESQPMLDLQDQKKAQESFKGVLSSFDSTLSALNTVLDSFSDLFASPFAARAASVGEGASFGASATDAAANGSHTLQVNRLASADARVSYRYATAGTALRSFFDANGPQTFSVDVAQPTADDPAARVSVSVTVAPQGTTDGEILTEIQAALNDAFGQAVADGVLEAKRRPAVSLVHETSDTARLSLASADTGYAGRLQFSDSAAGLLAALELNGPAVVDPDGAGGGMLLDVGTSETTSALNSVFVLDGLTLYRNTNTVTDALDGVTLSLHAVGDSASLTVGPDTESIVGDVKDFITKYNAALSFLKAQTTVNGDTGARGRLADDSAARSLRYDLRAEAARQTAGALGGLSALGITINDDGSLALTDQDQLEAALTDDAGAVQAFFAGDGGLAGRLQARLDRFLGTDGLIASRKDATDSRIEQLDRRIEQWDERLDRREATLREQFNRLQEVAALVSSQQQYLNAYFY